MPVKTYVLMAHTDATAPIYVTTGGQRIKLQKRPIEHAYTELTFFDNKTQSNRTIRLKLNTDKIYLDEQTALGMPAQITFRDGSFGNVPPTPAERKAVMFKNGTLRTTNPIVQKFLEASPQFKGFDGQCEFIKKPLYELLDKEAELDETIDDFDRRLEAANKIGAIKDLKEAQDMMIRLNGFYFTPPATLKECKQGLIAFLDDAEDEGLAKIMQDSVSVDEEIMITVGKAMHRGIISFTDIVNQVAIKSGEKWKGVKMISSDIAKEERQRLFSEFLGTPEGMPLLKDIQNRIGEPIIQKKTKKEKDKEPEKEGAEA